MPNLSASGASAITSPIAEQLGLVTIYPPDFRQLCFSNNGRWSAFTSGMISGTSFRMQEDVPLIIPEVNADHLPLLEKQSWRKSGGYIVTNPNCSAIGLVMALAPLADKFGIEKVFVVTMQAVSGAGYPGVASMDILGNVVPYIAREEEKMEEETRKLLGRLNGSG